MKPFQYAAVLYFFSVADVPTPGGFAIKLLEAMSSADRENRTRLVDAFPEYGIPFAVAQDVPGGLDAVREAYRVQTAGGPMLSTIIGRAGLETLARRIQFERDGE